LNNFVSFKIETKYLHLEKKEMIELNKNNKYRDWIKYKIMTGATNTDMWHYHNHITLDSVMWHNTNLIREYFVKLKINNKKAKKSWINTLHILIIGYVLT